MKPLINISERIKEIATLVPQCETFFDVGCDHGKLGAYCFFHGICEKVVFSDISQVNLDKAKRTTKGIPQNNLKYICCAGIPVEQENKFANSVVAICGLGAETIISILNGFEKKKNENMYFVLQPSTKEESLRQYLIDENFEIIKEVIIKEDGHFYCTMLASYPRIKTVIKEDSVFLGFVDDSQSEEVYIDYLNKKLNIAKKMITIKKKRKQDILNKTGYYEKQYQSISERIKGE